MYTSPPTFLAKNLEKAEYIAWKTKKACPPLFPLPNPLTTHAPTFLGTIKNLATPHSYRSAPTPLLLMIRICICILKHSDKNVISPEKSHITGDTLEYSLTW